ncbi:AsmA-like C-terminal domain-containing protein [Rhodospirillum sp. A1_3_36]|uniref:YhdP family protein n=1 Tax=Rhodospirillum sp. A1_3_36 TaxID=3391666 RepID=UPI0039A47B1E
MSWYNKEIHLVHGGVRYLFRVIGSVALLVLAACAFLAWRLEQGPLFLDFLTPQIEDALNRAGLPVHLRVGGTEVTWAGWERALDVRAIDVSLETPDGAMISEVPEISISVSGASLIKGELIVHSLEILRPSLTLVRLPDGRVSFGGDPVPLPLALPGIEPKSGASSEPEAPSPSLSSPSEDILDLVVTLDWIAEVLSQQTGGTVAEVRLTDASVTVEDMVLGARLLFPRVNAMLSSRGTRLTMTMGAHLALPEARPRFDIALTHERGAAEAQAILSFSGLDPRQVAKVVPGMSDNGMIDASLSGRVTGTLDLAALTGEDPRQGVKGLDFELTARDAYLTLPAAARTTYHMAEVVLAGHAGAALSDVSLDQLSIDLGDAVIEGSAEGHGLFGAPSLRMTTSLVGLNVEDLKRYWPRDVADGAREWIAQNLSEGTIQQADFQFDFQGASLSDLDIKGMRGYALVDDMAVDYRAPLPPLDHVTGEITFGLDGIGIDVEAGRIRGYEDLEVVSGSVNFVDFSKPVQRAEIMVKAAGSLASVLAVIDHDPLNYARVVGIEPAKAIGSVTTDLAFDFPLLKDLSFEQVDVTVAAQLQDAGLADLVFGHDLEKGRLTLNLTKAGMDVSGTALVSKVPAALTWRENFADADFQSKYQVKTTLDDAQRAVFDLDTALFQPPYMTGPAGVDLVYTRYSGGRDELTATLDLAGVAMALDLMDWSKPAGVPGQAKLKGYFSKTDAAIDFTADVDPGLKAVGTVRLDPKTGAAERLALSTLSMDKSWVKGEMVFGGAQGVEVRVDDGVLDLRPMLKRRKKDKEARLAGDPAVSESRDNDSMPPLILDMTLREVWLGDTTVLENLVGRMDRDAVLWRHIFVDTGLRDGPPLALRLGPALEGREGREFSLTAGDAGSLLRAVGALDTIDGGALAVSGRLDDQGTATGQAVVSSFHLKDAPVLAQVLSFAGLTGILDVLGGNGISFTEFNMPFVYTDPALHFTDARAYGNALGLTASGVLNLDTMNVDMEGTLVPAYAINSLLGHIPVLGDIILGGKGQGLFGVNYSVRGSIEDPRILVNPLSALTPGFLRGIFGIFDRPEQTAPEQTAPEQTATEKVRPGDG